MLPQLKYVIVPPAGLNTDMHMTSIPPRLELVSYLNRTLHEPSGPEGLGQVQAEI